jgi:transposase-like protein
VFTLTVNLPSESWCASVLRKVRWGKAGKTYSPRCGSSKTKKDGHYGSSYQKYFCKACERSFNDKTGTLFHYSHTPINRWFLAIYLFFVLWIGCSVRETSREAVIPYRRCYRFIRTIMERLLFLSIVRHTKLEGKVETDEFYLKAGLKGRSSYHEQTNSCYDRKRTKA